MPLLELCTDDCGIIETAATAGADRIELCSALSLGGLTPSAGLMRVAGRGRLPVHALIRPRAGNFVYSTAEADAMIEDIHLAARCGLRGVVLGAMREDGMPDLPLLRKLAKHSRAAGESTGRPLALVFHRAIDICPDIPAALDMVADLRFSHILSSGGAASAEQGAAMLGAMREKAAGRLNIIAGAGISAANVQRIARQTGLVEFHASCRTAAMPETGDARLSELGFAEAVPRRLDLTRLRQLREALSEHG